MPNEFELSLHNEVEPVPERKKKDKKWRKPRPGTSKRGPRRPYRSLEDAVIKARIDKYQNAVTRAQKGFEKYSIILKKYTQEQTLRIKDILEASIETVDDTPVVNPEFTTHNKPEQEVKLEQEGSVDNKPGPEEGSSVLKCSNTDQ